VTFSADLWALGCIIYQLLVGRPPFKGINEYQTFQLIQTREFTFPDSFDSSARDVIEHLLVMDPEMRIGNNSLDEIRAHQFFQGIDFQGIHLINPPAIPFLPIQSERDRKLLLQKSSLWNLFLDDHELILYNSLVVKKKGIRPLKRQLILTDLPRLIYVDINKMVKKGEIPFLESLECGLRGGKFFWIEVPGRVYTLEDVEADPQEWVLAIRSLHKKIYPLSATKNLQQLTPN